jgi:hypothetical protein
VENYKALLFFSHCDSYRVSNEKRKGILFKLANDKTGMESKLV